MNEVNLDKIKTMISDVISQDLNNEVRTGMIMNCITPYLSLPVQNTVIDWTTLDTEALHHVAAYDKEEHHYYYRKFMRDNWYRITPPTEPKIDWEQVEHEIIVVLNSSNLDGTTAEELVKYIKALPYRPIAQINEQIRQQGIKRRDEFLKMADNCGHDHMTAAIHRANAKLIDEWLLKL
jgi:hypothetical protein